jgi:hypothetical protein
MTTLITGLTEYVTNTVISSAVCNDNNDIISAAHNTHAAATTGEHGVTGSIAGTGGIQTLSAKLFGSSPATPVANTMYNESFIRAWGYIASDGSINSSHNVDSVTKGTTGGSNSYEIVLKTALSDINYVVSVSGGSSSVNYDATTFIVIRTNASTFKIFPFDAGGTTVDSADFSFMVIGVQ